MAAADLIPRGWVIRTRVYRDIARRLFLAQTAQGVASQKCPACGWLTLGVRSQKPGEARRVAECYECGKQYRVALVDVGKEQDREEA